LIAARIDAIFVILSGNGLESITMGLAKYADDGFFAPRKIADVFRTTSEEVARTAGLGRDAVQRQERSRSPKTQRRLREMVEVINKVEPRFGSELIAYAWYRSEPLPGFSGQTAMQLVREGRIDEVLDYVDAVDAGVHA
jgi:uncharacterized protein (DUF2384 family)